MSGRPKARQQMHQAYIKFKHSFHSLLLSRRLDLDATLSWVGIATCVNPVNKYLGAACGY